jgi:hypothetical protein
MMSASQHVSLLAVHRSVLWKTKLLMCCGLCAPRLHLSCLHSSSLRLNIVMNVMNVVCDRLVFNTHTLDVKSVSPRLLTWRVA